MSTIQPKQSALMSVFNKEHILELARCFVQHNIDILSTGGTAKSLIQAGIPVTEVSDYTQFPEMMNGRVKTLHPKIHGGILARRGIDDVLLKSHHIRTIDFVVVNLYPFETVIADPSTSKEKAIENIDIGGPTLLRAAAKNHQDVTVLCDPNDYTRVIEQLNAHSSIDEKTRLNFAWKTFSLIRQYDQAIEKYFNSLVHQTEKQTESDLLFFPENYSIQMKKQQTMRYGENPHQRAAFYVETPLVQSSIASAQQLQGKSLSFNNIADADAALECVKQFKLPTCVIVKHGNPCGVASANNIHDAYQRAYQCDPSSSFGGIIAFNQTIDKKTAVSILKQQFVEVIIAPFIDQAAQLLFSKKPSLRLLTIGHLTPHLPSLDFKKVSGGLLIQDKDLADIHTLNVSCVSNLKPSTEEMDDLHFAWKVAKSVKSNAIVYAKQQQSIGIGAGQMSRIDSATIAALKAKNAGLIIKHAVMASDAFFPFRDTIDAAAKVGIKAIIQPGGSIRDPEVIEAANEHKMIMIFTHYRHFKH
jgi:phosphoribosylaminoimidazolecarboxamide formyltransferase/IMP cyclohydrolase